MQKIGRICGSLLDNYVLAAVVAVLVVLCFTGVGMPYLIGILGLVLCVIGFVQKPDRADPYVLVLLIAYNACNMASSAVNNGDIMRGYAPIQMILPVLYLAVSSLPEWSLSLLKKLCAAWFVMIAGSGILYFLCQPRDNVRRLAWVLHNANAMGIFLVLGWFLILDTGRGEGRFAAVLRHAESVILSALALTMSMGSFVSMAVGISFVLLDAYKTTRSWKSVFGIACRLLARASLGISAGLLLYVAVSRTDIRLLGWLAGIYIAALAFSWGECGRFLDTGRHAAVLISCGGAAAALAMIFLRPGAVATFAERIAMMKNGLGYIPENPLFGVGAFEWRALNMADADRYFNTWHIHNVLIHAAVEFGMIAAAALVLLAAGILIKKKGVLSKAAFVAFVCHNMMDTSFFYIGISSMLIAILAVPEDGGRELPAAGSKLAFLSAGLFFAYVLYRMPIG